MLDNYVNVSAVTERKQMSGLDLEAMRSIDIRTVDPETLVDIRNVKIDLNKPLWERMIDFIKQVRNPYCFRCGDTIVKISHANTTRTLDDCMESFFRSLS